MAVMNTQISIDEIEFLEHLSKQPDRVAYIDECGSFGFDFSKEGTSKFYVLTAVIVDSDNIDKLHDDFVDVKRTNGLANTELKSSKVDDNRRQRIMHQLLPLDFRIVVFIADKEKFQKESPLSEFKKTFIKNMNSRMHRMLYQAFPKLKIVMDAFGYPEFQELQLLLIRPTGYRSSMKNTLVRSLTYLSLSAL